MQAVWFLLPILAVTVSLLVRAELRKEKTQIFIFKPTSTLIVIGIAALSINAPDWNQTYTLGVLVGLFFSLGGDVALMFQEDRRWFIIGLILFLLGHVAYTVVFWMLGSLTWWIWLAAAAIAFFGSTNRVNF